MAAMALGSVLTGVTVPPRLPAVVMPFEVSDPLWRGCSVCSVTA
jgi:hypothetical protein